MKELAYQITTENAAYLKTITGLRLETIENNPGWIVFRNENAYYGWRLMPAATFRASYPDTPIEVV